MKYLLIFVLSICSTHLKAVDAPEQFNVGEKIRISAQAGESLVYEFNHADEGKDLLIAIKPRKKDTTRVDADLFVWQPGQVNTDFARCRPLLRSAEETCLFKAAKKGVYKVRVNAVNDIESLSLISKSRKSLRGHSVFQKNIKIDLFNGQNVFEPNDILTDSFVINDTIYNGYIVSEFPRANEFLILINGLKYDFIKSIDAEANKSIYHMPVLNKGDVIDVVYKSNASFRYTDFIKFKGVEDSEYSKRKIKSNIEPINIVADGEHYVFEVPQELSGERYSLRVIGNKSIYINGWLKKTYYSPTAIESDFILGGNGKRGMFNVGSGTYYISIDQTDAEVFTLSNTVSSYIVPGTDCEVTPYMCGAF
jgi:hypothetical protein